MENLPNIFAGQVIKEFASSGDKTDLNSGITTDTNINGGIVPKYSLPISNGGAYAKREDFNAVFNLVSKQLAYNVNGGKPKYDSTISNAIGGYPNSGLLWGDDRLIEGQTAIYSHNGETEKNMVFAKNAEYVDVNFRNIVGQSSGDVHNAIDWLNPIEITNDTSNYVNNQWVRSWNGHILSDIEIPRSGLLVVFLGLNFGVDNTLAIDNTTYYVNARAFIDGNPISGVAIEEQATSRQDSWLSFPSRHTRYFSEVSEGGKLSFATNFSWVGGEMAGVMFSVESSYTAYLYPFKNRE